MYTLNTPYNTFLHNILTSFYNNIIRHMLPNHFENDQFNSVIFVYYYYLFIVI